MAEGEQRRVRVTQTPAQSCGTKPKARAGLLTSGAAKVEGYQNNLTAQLCAARRAGAHAPAAADFSAAGTPPLVIACVYSGLTGVPRGG